jgi:catechol-2,3-dioxygenase
LVAPCKIPDNTKVGLPVLRVRNVETVLAFYENKLGLQVNREYKDDEDHTPIYELGFKGNVSSSYEPLLILKHALISKKPLLHSAGLYHFAILLLRLI